MVYLILADIHSNLEALLAVLEAARGLGFDRTLLLGDLVGYGASPNPVLQHIRRLQRLEAIRGNHDKVAAGLEADEPFSSSAREAVLWTRGELTADNRRYLADLPRGPCVVEDRFYVSHGTPLDEDGYLLTPGDAQSVFRRLPFPLCFFGHTHIAGAFSLGKGGLRAFVPTPERPVLRLRPGVRYLVNPGSVGQPRDRDPKAGFARYDTARGEIRFHRVAYPVRRARARILRAGLPPELGERLVLGV